MKHNKTFKMILAALFLALAYVMPFFTGQIPEIGSMLCPMHIPVLLCGYLCGWRWGLLVGFLAPLTRSLFLGMPPLFPAAICMAFELATYGAVAGRLHRMFPRKKIFIYLSLLSAMVRGRLVWGVAMFICLGLSGGSFGFSAFLAGAITNAIPGIIVQLVLVPVIVMLLENANLFKKQTDRNGRVDTALHVRKHFERYPDLQIEDVFKFLHQSAFGPEHLLSSPEVATARIRGEAADMTETLCPLSENLDGNYARVHLSALAQGLAPETLGKLFYLSAVHEPEGPAALEEKLAKAREMIEGGALPFSLAEWDEKVLAWKKEGYSALHHSDSFRKAYAPAYRVIADRFIPFLPLFTEIDKGLAKGNVTLAIEGGSASGKTTLASMLEQVYDCSLLHMDDFFLQSHQRTKERLAEPGGNVDRERFLEEVLLPLSRREPIEYRPFDCATGSISFSTRVMPKPLTVIEGAYSMHPDLAPYYNLSVFLNVDQDTQKKRILKRNTPQMAERFFKEWIPLEHTYFDKMDTKSRCDMVVTIKE